MKVSNGSHEETKILDDNGSTESSETKYFGKGHKSYPVRHRFRIRRKVANQREEQEEYATFSDDLITDKTMLDPVFEIEHTKKGDEEGYYFVIRCYTKLEY